MRPEASQNRSTIGCQTSPVLEHRISSRRQESSESTEKVIAGILTLESRLWRQVRALYRVDLTADVFSPGLFDVSCTETQGGERSSVSVTATRSTDYRIRFVRQMPCRKKKNQEHPPAAVKGRDAIARDAFASHKQPQGGATLVKDGCSQPATDYFSICAAAMSHTSIITRSHDLNAKA